MGIPDLLKAIFNLLATLNPAIALLLGFLTAAVAAFNYFNDLWAVLFVKVDALALNVMPTLGFAPLGMVNLFFPLSELFTYVAAYFVLYLACSAIKVIKAFVPFLAS